MIPFDSGTPPPIFDNFHQTDSVGSRSEINLLINRVRKVEKRIQSWTLWKDLLQYNAICAIFFAFRHRNRKVDGGHWGVQKREKPEFLLFEFGLGTPLPLETSAARSHNRLSLDSRAPGILR